MIQNKGYAIISLNWGVNQTVNITDQMITALSSISGIAPNLLVAEALETGVIYSREDHMISQNMIVVASNRMLLDEICNVIKEYGEDANSDGVLEAIYLGTPSMDGVEADFILIRPNYAPVTFGELDTVAEFAEERVIFDAIYLPNGMENLDKRITILQNEYRKALLIKIQFVIFAYFEDNKLIGKIPFPDSMLINFHMDETAYVGAVRLSIIDLVINEAEYVLDFEKGEYYKDFVGYQENDIEQIPSQVSGLVSDIAKVVNSNEIRGLFGDEIKFDANIFLEF